MDNKDIDTPDGPSFGDEEAREDVQLPQLSAALAKFYSVNGKSTDMNLIADCLQCKKSYSASTKATSNLVIHLRRVHKVQYAEYETLRAAEEKKKRESCASHSQHKMTSFFKTKPPQENKFNTNHIKQRSMVKKLLDSIACDQLPLSIVESKTFRALLHEAEPRFVFPSRTTLRSSLLLQRANDIKSQLMKEFENLSLIYLTLDLWTNRKMISFLAVTVHFINSSWELKSRVIACDQFVERHTAVNIATAYEDIVTKFGIRGKVRKVVADNASSMVRAFDICLPGLYGNEVKNESIKENGDIDNLDILEEELDLNEVLALLPPDRSSCFAHTQQLCIRDAFNDPCVRNSAIATVIHKCCSIVAAIRRSTVAAPFLEKIGVSLQAANATRWNSQLTMLKSVLKDVNGVNSAIRLLGSCKTVEELKGMEIAMLKEVVQILDPFQEAMSQVEGENMVTLSCVAPVVFGLEHSLKLFMESKPIYCLNLANALQSSIKKRLHPFLERTDVIAAAVMDPRFKLAWLSCEEIKMENISKIVDLIISESTQLSLKNTVQERESFMTVSTNQDKAGMSAKRPRLFAYMPPAGKLNVSPSTSDTAVVKAELESYLEEGVLAFDVNPLRYWRENKSFNILKPFARNILGCCATSAPSERVFSKAGNFYTPERAKLGPETFRALMMIKCNYDI